MKIRFLGTGAAEGAPAIFCRCETCKELRRRGEKEYHTRAQYLIDGALGIDFPPDAYYHALRYGVDLCSMRALLVTHTHMDHFYAHDFILRGYKYTTEPIQPLIIYGNAEMLKVFKECTKREMKEVVAKNYQLVEVKPFEAFTCGEAEEYTVIPLLAQHSKEETAFVYLVEKAGKAYLHLTDTGRLPKSTLNYLEAYCNSENKKVDFVTFDCTFLTQAAGETSRHMGLEDNKVMQEEFLRRNIVDEHTRYAITHFSHNSQPFSERLNALGEKYGYIPAYDGMEIEF